MWNVQGLVSEVELPAVPGRFHKGLSIYSGIQQYDVSYTVFLHRAGVYFQKVHFILVTPQVRPDLYRSGLVIHDHVVQAVRHGCTVAPDEFQLHFQFGLVFEPELG